MRISDWSSEVCSSDLACLRLPLFQPSLAEDEEGAGHPARRENITAISKGNGASGAFAILTELTRRLAEIAPAKALTSQLSAGVFCDQLDVDGAGLARQAEPGPPHKAWPSRRPPPGVAHPARRLRRAGVPVPSFALTPA